MDTVRLPRPQLEDMTTKTSFYLLSNFYLHFPQSEHPEHIILLPQVLQFFLNLGLNIALWNCVSDSGLLTEGLGNQRAKYANVVVFNLLCEGFARHTQTEHRTVEFERHDRQEPLCKLLGGSLQTQLAEAVLPSIVICGRIIVHNYLIFNMLSGFRMN